MSTAVKTKVIAFRICCAPGKLASELIVAFSAAYARNPPTHNESTFLAIVVKSEQFQDKYYSV
jgi:hypothetical protein